MAPPTLFGWLVFTRMMQLRAAASRQGTLTPALDDALMTLAVEASYCDTPPAADTPAGAQARLLWDWLVGVRPLPVRSAAQAAA